MKLKTITWDFFSKHNPCYDPQDSYGDFSGTILDILKDERIPINENVNKPYSYFLRWTNDAGADVRRNFSGHMQAWFDTEKEAMDDYNERISDGKYIPYPPKKDITNGMWNSEPEWGLSGYGFRDEETFNNSMEEINDIAWHHSENLQQDLIVFRSSNFILGDGFDGEDVFRDADKYWYIEPDMNYNDVMNIIEEMDRFTK